MGGPVRFAGDDPQLPPEPPAQHRNEGPGYQRGSEGARNARSHGEVKDGGECQETDASPGGAGRVQRGGLLPAARAAEAGLLLGAAFMAFDQRGAGAEDSGKRKEESADGHTEARPQNPREHGRQAAEQETNAVFVPACLLQRGERQLDRHQAAPPKPASRPKATANHTITARTVAGSADTQYLISRWQTTTL